MRNSILALTLLTSPALADEIAKPKPKAGNVMAGNATKLWYTTYFYTAAEAVIHGYEDGTQVRIVSLEKNGTVFEGVVNRGQTKLVGTGRGAFGFLSDKKASILVGTPSSCTAVGYFVKDQDGTFKSKHFITELPSSVSAPGARVVLWAWEDLSVTVTDRTSDKLVWKGELKAGGHHDIPYAAISNMGSHVLELASDVPALMVQVYYDEGFLVPSQDGRAAGKTFYAYVGDITEGVNDLQLISYNSDVEAKVVDLENKQILWRGKIGRRGIKTLTLSKKYVQVVADREIAVFVAPYEHYKAGYAEHHFSMGAEGTGIEHDFLITSPGELWIFSYFKGAAVEVTNAVTGEKVWSGTMDAGHGRGLTPGYGYFSVKSTKGISVMAGSAACGGEYSPAAGMFAVDEALFQVVREIREERRQKASAEGRVLSYDEASAPLSGEEMKRAKAVIQASPAAAPISDSEIQERLDTMVAE